MEKEGRGRPGSTRIVWVLHRREEVEAILLFPIQRLRGRLLMG
jgi:hypothetical protein